MSFISNFMEKTMLPHVHDEIKKAAEAIRHSGIDKRDKAIEAYISKHKADEQYKPDNPKTPLWFVNDEHATEKAIAFAQALSKKPEYLKLEKASSDASGEFQNYQDKLMNKYKNEPQYDFSGNAPYVSVWLGEAGKYRVFKVTPEEEKHYDQLNTKSETFRYKWLTAITDACLDETAKKQDHEKKFFNSIGVMSIIEDALVTTKHLAPESAPQKITIKKGEGRS